MTKKKNAQSKQAAKIKEAETALRLPNPNAVVERRGLSRRPAGDVYHYLLTTPWPVFFGLIASAYLFANAVFALAYTAWPGCLESATPGSLGDAFFFSIQTMATIGYGKMVPANTYANVLVTLESLLGILGVALVTGLTFAKFARPTARVLFSEIAVITTRDGARSFMFRMANERQSNIHDVNIHVVFAHDDVTVEGERVRRFHTLPLSRSRVATFALSWTAVHVINEESPLFGRNLEDLKRVRAGIIVTLTGIDETFAQQVHAHHDYSANAILFDRSFVDVLSVAEDGHRIIDYGKFHDTRPA
jgi:inward rectifier potassium channel